MSARMIYLVVHTYYYESSHVLAAFEDENDAIAYMRDYGRRRHNWRRVNDEGEDPYWEAKDETECVEVRPIQLHARAAPVPRPEERDE